MRIYTRTGDRGETSLYSPKSGARRVRKDARRVVTYGTVDELNSHIGLLVARLGDSYPDLCGQLGTIQNDLFSVGYDFATIPGPEGVPVAKVSSDMVDTLERWIDVLSENLPPLKTFVLPGGVAVAAEAHVARTVARRAEREAVSAAEEELFNSEALRYLNRLSDYLFILARELNRRTRTAEPTVQW